MNKYLLTCQFNYTPKNSEDGYGVGNHYCELKTLSKETLDAVLEQFVKLAIQDSYPKDTKIKNISILNIIKLDE